MHRLLLLLALIASLLLPTAARANPIEPEKAFAMRAQALDAQTIEVVFMRLMVALDRVYKELRVDLVKSRLLLTIWDLGQNALNEAKDNPPGPALRGRYAVDFCAAWTDYLKFRLNQAAGLVEA